MFNNSNIYDLVTGNEGILDIFFGKELCIDIVNDGSYNLIYIAKWYNAKSEEGVNVGNIICYELYNVYEKACNMYNGNTNLKEVEKYIRKEVDIRLKLLDKSVDGFLKAIDVANKNLYGNDSKTSITIKCDKAKTYADMYKGIKEYCTKDNYGKMSLLIIVAGGQVLSDTNFYPSFEYYSEKYLDTKGDDYEDYIDTTQAIDGVFEKLGNELCKKYGSKFKKLEDGIRSTSEIFVYRQGKRSESDPKSEEVVKVIKKGVYSLEKNNSKLPL